MLDNTVVQRVDSPGVKRGDQRLHANAQAGVDNDDEGYGRVESEANQAAAADGRNQGAWDYDTANAQLIEQAASEEAHDGAQHSARQHDKAGFEGRYTEQVLQIDGEQNACANQRGLEQGNQNDNDGI